MKKIAKLFICLLSVSFLAGCGVSKFDDVKSSSNDQLQKFVEQNKSSIAALSTDMMTAELVARDNLLVYKYTYTETYSSEMLETMKKYFDASFEEQGDTFKKSLNQIRTEIPTLEALVVEYYNGDNTLIYSMDFK